MALYHVSDFNPRSRTSVLVGGEAEGGSSGSRWHLFTGAAGLVRVWVELSVPVASAPNTKGKGVKIRQKHMPVFHCPTVETPQYLLPSSPRQRHLYLKRPRFGADVSLCTFIPGSSIVVCASLSNVSICISLPAFRKSPSPLQIQMCFPQDSHQLSNIVHQNPLKQLFPWPNPPADRG